MPYKSEKQRRFMHAKHPDIAARWDKKYGGKVERHNPNLAMAEIGYERASDIERSCATCSYLGPGSRCKEWGTVVGETMTCSHWKG